MIFAEQWFLIFLVATVAAVWLAPARLRRLTLLVACVFFHAHYAGQAGMTPIILLAAMTFAAYQLGKGARTATAAAIAICVGALVYYKYTGFLDELTGWKIPVVAAPLAISFFVFEFVHLLTDRRQGKSKERLKLLDFSLFTIFFPSLASGPIKRYQQFAPELQRLGLPALAFLEQSAVRVLLGYYKKFVLADALSREIPAADQMNLWHGSVLTLSLLLGARIFLDFSGYSDIAIGFAGLLNIRLPENFSFPYLTTNISEFWRRWHISLSTWIRDYIYIVLGGNRVSQLRRFANLLAAMVLCGLWHGAATHFGLWGLMQGLALLGVHFWRLHARVKLPPAVGWALTFAFVQASWLIFFYDVPTVLGLLRKGPIL